MEHGVIEMGMLLIAEELWKKCSIGCCVDLCIFTALSSYWKQLVGKLSCPVSSRIICHLLFGSVTSPQRLV